MNDDVRCVAIWQVYVCVEKALDAHLERGERTMYAISIRLLA